jgi:D-alanine-D-alanine ligase
MTHSKTLTVGVLMGGMSSERPISLKSGAAVAEALRSRGYTVVEIDVGPDTPAKLLAAGIDVAWLALHGSFGEDGCIQGLLEIMRIPYTGAGVRGSAIAMDKIASKRLLRGTGVALPEDSVWRKGEPFPSDLKFPVVAKTPNGGSTIGIHICKDQAQLEAALVDCGMLENEILLEQFVAGREITVAVLKGSALPVVEIRPIDGYFDFEAKYTKGKTEYLVPAPIAPIVAATASQHAEIAYRTLGLSGVARADFIIDDAGIPWFLEINTIPGMTATSLTPMAAGATGVCFEELVEITLQAAQLHIVRGDTTPDPSPQNGAKHHPNSHQ